MFVRRVLYRQLEKAGPTWTVAPANSKALADVAHGFEDPPKGFLSTGLSTFANLPPGAVPRIGRREI
jgi:hypothetical protein